MQRKTGSTSQIAQFQITNSSTGAPLTGLLFNTAGLAGYYKRNKANVSVAISLQTMTLGTWASGGFVEVDATNMPGLYEFGVPNAALLTGADLVTVTLSGAATLLAVPLQIELTAVDNQSAASFITGVNGVAPPANWNLFSIDVLGHITVVTNLDKTGYSLTQTFPSNFAALSIDSSGRVTLVPGQIAVEKNKPLNAFEFLMVSSGAPKTGLTITAARSIDGAAPSLCANTAVEIDASTLPGIYSIDLAASDLNGNVVTLFFTGTGADARYVTIVTQQ